MAIPTEPTLSTRIRTLSRGAGRNAPAFSAYISGTAIEPGPELQARLAEAGRTDPAGPFDFRQRAWNVEHAELVTPAGAPEWARGRQTLWNRVEAKETGANAQVARDFRFSFSYDLTAGQRRDLACQIAHRFADMGMCADMAVHRYGQRWDAADPKTAAQVGKWQAWGIPFVDATRAASLDSEHIRVTRKRDGTVKDYRLFQPHCHILLTMRPFTADGQGFEGKTDKREALGKGSDGKYRYRVVEKSKARQWNDQALYEPLRGEIADRQNAMLAANGSPRRIDARGYEDRRAEAVELATAAKAARQREEAARQDHRAALLLRDPQPYLGVVRRVKGMTEEVRERRSQWVAARHKNRLQPQIDELWNRNHVTFVAHAHRLLELARRHAGLEPEPELRPATVGHPDEGLEL